MIQDKWRNLDNPAVKAAGAYHGMTGFGRDEISGRAFIRTDSFSYVRFTCTVTADHEFILLMIVPIVMKPAVAACLKTERITRGGVHDFVFYIHA
jgi:hypothetical protein